MERYLSIREGGQKNGACLTAESINTVLRGGSPVRRGSEKLG